MTDLEDLVRRMSGRGAGGRGGAHPLDDPDGDAARVLDEIRRRTRALLDEPEDADLPDHDGPRPGRAGVPLAGRPRRRGILSGLALFLLGATLALTLDRAWPHAERPAAERPDREVRRALAAIEARLAVAPVPGPVPAADPAVADLGRGLDARLAALDARLARLDRDEDGPGRPAGPDAPRPPGASDPAIAAIGADLAAIRRELAGSEAATARQVQEMRTILQQLNTEARRVMGRPEPSQSAGLAPVLALAVQALVHNLQHPSAQVRGEAVEQLARIGPTARTAIPALRDRFARESDHNVRAAIEAALSILTSN